MDKLRIYNRKVLVEAAGIEPAKPSGYRVKAGLILPPSTPPFGVFVQRIVQ